MVRSKENPMADMLLYVQYNKKTRQVRMLQVPRDMFVVTDESWHGYTMGTGKINAVFAHGPNENKVQNIVDVFNRQLKLPVDHYITIDMEHFKRYVRGFRRRGMGAGSVCAHRAELLQERRAAKPPLTRATST